MSLVTRQPTRKHEFKCHLDISQVENCLLSNFDLNDPHGTHCHRLDCDTTFLSNISRLMHTHTHSQWLHATRILGGVQKKFHAIGMRIRWQDGLKGNKAPKDWEEGETRETWGRSALVLTYNRSQILPHVYYHVTGTVLRSRRHARRSLVSTELDHLVFFTQVCGEGPTK